MSITPEVIFALSPVSWQLVNSNEISIRTPYSPSLPPPSSMSVLLETSVGDIVIDLLADYAPKCCEK